ncbi:hypothetical protein G6R40_02635 [Chryseobacterium sp. POL2]|uniref:hypothetical protein n=1 Tax=Chryseobacterium sp. POL2 TaxID=2713414 RepID=UPI0013E16CB3|nr:hypothetical protein [Chryseobacterium sp. POL2]QIG88627.1 hypothetical protein G6R40_02635 [Chryseobacterium sp. POL2]
MKDTANNYYIIKFWILSIIFAILIFILGSAIKSKSLDLSFIGFGIFMFFYSIIYSFPTFLVVFLISKFGMNNLYTKNKLILSGISTLLILLTIYASFGKEKYDVNGNFSALTFSIVSAIGIFISTIFLNIKKTYTKK